MLNFCFFFLRILEVNSFFLRRNILYKQTEPGMCWCTLGSCLGKRVAEGRGVLFFPSSAALGSLDLTPWQHRSDLNPQKQSAQGSAGGCAVLCCAVLRCAACSTKGPRLQRAYCLCGFVITPVTA